MTFDGLCDRLPQVAGAVFGIEEGFDQARLDFLLLDVRLARRQLAEGVQERFREREALDALRAPFGGNFMAGHAPHLFRIIAEERAIEFGAELVDQVIFQRILRFALKQAGE